MSEPPAVPPEDRDWTFVITDGCAECGFDPQPPESTGQRVRASIPIWRKALAASTAQDRPAPAVWSAVEYGCHVRDACQNFRQRLELMLHEDDPIFANWDQDAAAVARDYYHQHPLEVAAALTNEATKTADAFDAIRAGEWHRSGRRSNGSVFSVATFAVYFLHDIDHHVRDVAPVQPG